MARRRSIVAAAGASSLLLLLLLLLATTTFGDVSVGVDREDHDDDHDDDDDDDDDQKPEGDGRDVRDVILHALLSLLCVICAAIAAGLTLGMLSLDPVHLEIKRRSSMIGSDERRMSELLLPLIASQRRRHRLLVSLLLLNSLANEAVSFSVGVFFCVRSFIPQKCNTSRTRQKKHAPTPAPPLPRRAIAQQVRIDHRISDVRIILRRDHTLGDVHRSESGPFGRESRALGECDHVRVIPHRGAHREIAR